MRAIPYCGFLLKKTEQLSLVMDKDVEKVRVSFPCELHAWTIENASVNI